MEPILRFQYGDVIVKLRSDPKGWLLLHKHVLLRYMPTLATGMKDGFPHPGSFTIHDAITGSSRTIFVHSAVLVENTILLVQAATPEEHKILACDRAGDMRIFQLLVEVKKTILGATS
jgi:hypothetical protein